VVSKLQREPSESESEEESLDKEVKGEDKDASAEDKGEDDGSGEDSEESDDSEESLDEEDKVAGKDASAEDKGEDDGSGEDMGEDDGSGDDDVRISDRYKADQRDARYVFQTEVVNNDVGDDYFGPRIPRTTTTSATVVMSPESADKNASAAAEKPAAEDDAIEKPAAEKAAIEKAAAEKPAAKDDAIEKPAAEKAAIEEKPAAEKAAAEKPAAEKAAAEKAAAIEKAKDEEDILRLLMGMGTTQQAAEKAATEKAAKDAAIEKAAVEKATEEDTAIEKAAAEKATEEDDAAEKPAAEKAAAEKAATEKAAKDAAIEKAAAEKATEEDDAIEKPAAEKAAHEKAAAEKAATAVLANFSPDGAGAGKAAVGAEGTPAPAPAMSPPDPPSRPAISPLLNGFLESMHQKYGAGAGKSAVAEKDTPAPAPAMSPPDPPSRPAISPLLDGLLESMHQTYGAGAGKTAVADKDTDANKDASAENEDDVVILTAPPQSSPPALPQAHAPAMSLPDPPSRPAISPGVDGLLESMHQKYGAGAGKESLKRNVGGKRKNVEDNDTGPPAKKTNKVTHGVLKLTTQKLPYAHMTAAVGERGSKKVEVRKDSPWIRSRLDGRTYDYVKIYQGHTFDDVKGVWTLFECEGYKKSGEKGKMYEISFGEGVGTGATMLGEVWVVYLGKVLKRQIPPQMPDKDAGDDKGNGEGKGGSSEYGKAQGDDTDEDPLPNTGDDAGRQDKEKDTSKDDSRDAWKSITPGGYEKLGDTFLASFSKDPLAHEGRMPITGDPVCAAYVCNILNKGQMVKIYNVIHKHLGLRGSRVWPLTFEHGEVATCNQGMSMEFVLFFITVAFSTVSSVDLSGGGSFTKTYVMKTVDFDANRFNRYMLNIRGRTSKLAVDHYRKTVNNAGLMEWYGKNTNKRYDAKILELMANGKPLEFASSSPEGALLQHAEDTYYGVPTNDDHFVWDPAHALRTAFHCASLTLLPGIMGNEACNFGGTITDLVRKHPLQAIAFGADASSLSWATTHHKEIFLAEPTKTSQNPPVSINFTLAEVTGGEAARQASSREMQGRRVGADVRLEPVTHALRGDGVNFHRHMWSFFKGLGDVGVPGLTQGAEWGENFGAKWQEHSAARVRDVALHCLAKDTPTHVDFPEELGGGGDGAIVVNYNATETCIVLFVPHADLKESDGSEARARYVVLHAGDTWIMQGPFRQYFEHGVYRIFQPQTDVADSPELNRYALTVRAGTLSKDDQMQLYKNWGEDLPELRNPEEKWLQDEKERHDPNATPEGPKTPLTIRGVPGSRLRALRPFAHSSPGKQSSSSSSAPSMGQSAPAKHSPISFSAPKRSMTVLPPPRPTTAQERENLTRGCANSTRGWIPGGAVNEKKFKMTDCDTFQACNSIRHTQWPRETSTMTTGFVGIIKVKLPSGIEEWEVTVGAVGIFVARERSHRIAILRASRSDDGTGGSKLKHIVGSVDLGSSKTWWPHLRVTTKGHTYNDFPSWTKIYFDAKRPAGMGAFHQTLKSLLGNTIPQIELTEKDDGKHDEWEGDDDDADVFSDGHDSTPRRTLGAKAVTGARAATATRATATDKRSSEQMGAEMSSQGGTKHHKPADETLTAAVIGRMGSDFDERLADMKKTAEEDERRKKEKYDDAMLRQQKAAAADLEAQRATMQAQSINALEQQRKNTLEQQQRETAVREEEQKKAAANVRGQTKTDESALTWSMKMNEKFMESMIQSRILSDEAAVKLGVSKMEALRLDRMQQARRNELRQEREMERDKRNQLMVALTLTQQHHLGHMVAPGQAPLGAAPTPRTAHQHLMPPEIPDHLALTHQDASVDNGDAENERMEVLLATMKKRAEQAERGKVLRKRIAEQQMLIDAAEKLDDVQDDR
jgi:hypothetical protein